tara:strand:- start:7744 stop:8091 length:348 start_codon:yes stop_codon:yes gene_type:complete
VDQKQPSYRVASALDAYLRVKRDGSGDLIVAVDGDTTFIGTTNKKTLAAQDLCSVNLRNQGQIVKMVASEAIADNAVVYQDAGGKVQTVTAGTVVVGIAMSAADADGDVFHVLEY